ncbi:MAG TPA: hypothetical protein VJO53_14640 [Candidatus Acidoferrales bacterium]|nr:hypothetical protein [Candidatus Acidoferrales bacterium]
MKQLSGPLYVVTGLLCDFLFAIVVGAMLGMTTPVYSLAGFIRTPIVCLGPSLLVLTGVATIIGGPRRITHYLLTSAVVLAGLAAWSVPKIGWQATTWLFLYPEAASLLGAVVILLVVRRFWIAALIGTLLSSPFFLYATVASIKGWWATGSFSATEVWLIAPTAMLLLCFVSSLRVRTD